MSNFIGDDKPGHEGRGGKAREVVGMFLRKDPAESPKPPDLTGQGLGEEVEQPMAVDDDPLRLRPDDALTDLSRPETEGAIVPSADIGELLVNRGIATMEQIATAEKVVKRTPGKQLSQALVEMGADERRIQEIVAQVSRLPYERIDTEADGAFDHKLLNRLGLEFCKANLVIPLRREGNRLVVGQDARVPLKDRRAVRGFDMFFDRDGVRLAANAR